MSYESTNRIKRLLDAADRKMGAKSIDLSSAVKMLGDGYAGTKASEYTSTTTDESGVQFASLNRIKAVLDTANRKTGYNDGTLTDAVQRLCDGYVGETPLYSFGALADLHIQYETGLTDFARALTYLKDRVPFTCVCGDLVAYATAENMEQYKLYVETYTYSQSGYRMPLYECAGNHETYDYIDGVVTGKTLTGELLERWKNATGKEPYYAFAYGNDVFIFLSLNSESPSNLFVEGGLEWLATTLETYKNNRCFVFQHVQDPADNTADPSHRYSPILNGTHGAEFLRLIKKYKNTIWFHGHTHLAFQDEQYPIGEDLGYRSVHIPSLAMPRFYDAESNSIVAYYFDEYGNKVWGSSLAEGYIVDVYENKIVLRGINFAAGTNADEVEPFVDEIYAIDTTL